MKKLLPSIFLSILFAFAGTLVYAQNSPSGGNQVNIATFVSPMAHYDHIWLHPRDTDMADPCEAGTVFFSASQNDLVYCQDDGTGIGTGAFNVVGGGFWKKTGDNIYPKDTATNPNLKIGLGKMDPEALLDVAGDVILQGKTSGDFKWFYENSQLSIGDITLNPHNVNQIGINLGLAANPGLNTDNIMAVVGGNVIIGDTSHIHIGGAGGGGVGGGGGGVGGGGGGANTLTNTVFTVVGDSDFVGQGYFHDDVAMENDLTVNGAFTATGATNFGALTATSLTVGTINAARICVNGACGDPFWKVWVNGQIHETSDGRFKTNLTPIPHGLETIAQLNPLSYQWKNLDKDETGTIITKDGVNPDVHLGLIAQEVYKIIPDVVNKPDDESKDMWSINYQEIVPVLIQAAKEQKSEFDALKAEVEALKQELNALKKSP